MSAIRITRRLRRAKVPNIDDKIDILNRTAVETSAAKKVYRAVGVMLSLVRVGARSAPICELSLMI